VRTDCNDKMEGFCYVQTSIGTKIAHVTIY